jgi:hypothetical protein
MMQALADWSGDVASLIREMKRRADVRTDTELAKVLGVDQSTVSTWRRRGAIPEATLLSFERLNRDAKAGRVQRFYAARTVTIRVAEFMYERSRERGGRGDRWLAYSTLATAFESVQAAIEDSLAKLELTTKRWPMDLASDLINDVKYLGQVADWVEAAEFGDILGGIAHRPDQVILP